MEVWRRINGPVYDEITNNLRRRYNKLYNMVDVTQVTGFILRTKITMVKTYIL